MPGANWLTRISNLQWTAFGVLAVFGLYALFTFADWELRDRYTPTGDEPFYLIAADGIWRDHVFEQTIPVRREIDTPRIYKAGLAKTDTGEPRWGLLHLVGGPHGLFTVHGLGLPAVLALPYAIAGTIGAKLMMIALISTIAVIGWRLTAYFGGGNGVRGWSVVAVFVAMPFIPAANQIYPDLIGGVICAFGLLGLMRMRIDGEYGYRWAFALAVAAMPWLHVRLSAPAAILVLAAVITARRRGLAAAALEVIPFLVSLGLLAAYQDYAFGSPFGWYGASSMAANAHAAMVFVGLFLDQNQGMLAQNPVLWVGIVFTIPFVRRYPFVGLAAIAAAGSTLLPNAMHTNWYGGGSFSGRFGWTAICLLAVPALYGLCWLGQSHRRLAAGIVSAGIAYQTFEFVLYAGATQNLYQHFNKPLAEYSIFFGPFGQWLPAFYDVTWAAAHWPNWVALVALAAALLAGTWIGAEPQKNPGGTGLPATAT